MRYIEIDTSELKCTKCGSTKMVARAFPKQKRGSLGYGKTYYDVEIDIACSKCGEVIKREGNR